MNTQQPNRQLRNVEINFWPGLIDLLTSILMVFLLISLLQTLSLDDLEAITSRMKQGQFLKILENRFANEVRNGIIKADPHLSFVQITFSDRVLFKSGAHRLQPEGQDLLRRLAVVLATGNRTGYQQIQVEGHTDDRPLHQKIYPHDNWELSAARAIEVVRFLRDTCGLRSDEFSANGYADNRPVADNTTEESRAQNRRIEIRLFFAGVNRS